MLQANENDRSAGDADIVWTAHHRSRIRLAALLLSSALVVALDDTARQPAPVDLSTQPWKRWFPGASPLTRPAGAPVLSPSGAPVVSPAEAPVLSPSGTGDTPPSDAPITTQSGAPTTTPAGAREHADTRDPHAAKLLPADWFTRQRAYPYGAIPERERRRAFSDARTFAALARTPRTAAWQLAGPINVGGRVTDIAMGSLDPGTLFMGAADGGVFRSTDEGNTWTPIFDDQISLSIGDIAVAPSDPSIVYVGTGEANAAGDTYAGDGIYRTTDGGNTFTHAGLEETAKIGRIVVHPTNPDHAYVAAAGRLFSTNPERGVFRTTNGGVSWDHVLFVNDSTGVVDIVINPEDPDQLFAAAWERIRHPDDRRVGGPGSGIYTTNDGGDSWTLLGALEGLPAPANHIGRIGLSLCAAEPSVVYAIYYTDPGNLLGIYRTDDGGGSWSRVDDGSASQVSGGFGWYFGQIRVDPTDPDIVFALGVPLLRSTNRGVSWASVGSGTHVDNHALLVDPTNPARVFLGNDGGFYRSTTGGTGWTKSSDLPLSQFYAITVDAQLPHRIYGGVQDNSTLRTLTGATDDWDVLFGGDGFYTLVDPNSSNIIYAEFQYGGLGKSTDLGQSFDLALSGIPSSERRNWSTPVVMDPSSASTLYYGTFRVFRSMNAAFSWAPISPDLTNGQTFGNLTFGTVTTIAAAESDPDHILAGTDDGNVWITTDGGAFWNRVSDELPDRWITRVAFDPTDETVLYVTLSGYRIDEPLPHIFRSQDSGNTWMDIASNLPALPLNDIVVDPENVDRLFVAADAGVYWTANGGASWQPLGVNLPPAAVHDLHLDAGSRTLVAGTHGRSAYTFSLDAIVSTPAGPAAALHPIVSVAPNPTTGAATFHIATLEGGRVRADLFDARGRLVRRLDDRHHESGDYEVHWDGTNAAGHRVAAGVYFYRILTSSGPVVGRLVVGS